MNLMKSFNRNYMIQNLKKSKSVLAFFLGILPIISILSFLILAGNTSLGNITLESISIVHYIGICFIPIMLSVCLFGFVYKKKSVDFMGSMPLSRKALFTTNTITGILLLLFMVVLSGLGIYITSILINVILPFRMIADYILIWSMTYIFVFILSNIAMGISGNTMTQLVVMILLLFFIPFLMDFVTAGNHLSYGNFSLCIESTNVDPYVEKFCNFIENTNESNYTLPYNNIRGLFMNWNYLYNPISLIKMFVISILGYIIGRVLFLKRKMEINETSFRNLRVHNLVKALTMFPMIALIVIAISNENPPLLALICIVLFLLVYFFIYDLITKKSISNIKTSLLHFCVILCVLFSISMILHEVFYPEYNAKTIYIDDKDVTSIQFSLYTTGYSEFEYVDIQDSKTVQLVLEKLNEGVNGSSGPITYKQMVIKTKKDSYQIIGRFIEEDYNDMIAYIEKTDDIKNTKTILDTNKVYALGFEEWYMKDYTNDSKIINAAKEVIQDGTSCQNEYQYNQRLSLYAYVDGKVLSYAIDSCQSSILSEYMEKVINQRNKDFLDRIKNISYTNAVQKGITYDWNQDYNIHSFEIDIDELNEKMRANTKGIYSFMKKYSNDSFDSTKEYVSIQGFLSGKEYSYYTNRVEELLKAIGILKEEILEEDSDDTH